MNNIPIAIVGEDKSLKLESRIKKLITEPKVNILEFKNLESLLDTELLQNILIVILTDDIISINPKTSRAKIKFITKSNPRIQILIFVKEENVVNAVKTLQVGAYQYVKQPVNDEELKLIIETAIEKQPKIIDKNIINNKGKNRFGEIIGGTTGMLKVYDQIWQAAKTDIPVLVLGETGTGKDLVSYTIHKMSERSDEAYLAVNLGALPSDLVASELFGHEKGTFTGALHQHKGVFEQGDKGTVFLDEIDTMDEKVQVSLLRLLEQKKFKRLGGTRLLQSNGRLIAATNENIDSLVESGVFRTDLFYRLDVFRISIPPLRERKNDIPLLVEEMMLKYSKMYKKNITLVRPKVIDALMNFDWPGNVRELKNVIQRAVLVCNDSALEVDHLPSRFHKKRKKISKLSFNIGTPLADVEREMVVSALTATNNNRKEAAILLGISRRALYNKLEKYKI